MLNNLTWGTYFTAVIAILAIYEAAIMLLFYRAEITALLQRRSTSAGNNNNDNKKTEAFPGKDEIFEGIDSVVAGLRDILAKAGKDASKAELLSRLSKRLENYAGLQHRVFGPAINNDIIAHARKLCGVNFSIEELNNEWKRFSG
ncbi:hypothetical protein [Pedobacter borealis]|uniref:hypothetical protein n=1 Tax=Pedobacter borealis TaxID=475254 RepID=UPI000493A9A2|nr:hypothetical protein [Pedobacter borealis]